MQVLILIFDFSMSSIGQCVHDIATNYIDTDLEVSGSSFKETAIEGNKQTNNVNERTCSARPRWQLATPGEKVEYLLKRTYHKNTIGDGGSTAL